MSLPASGVPFLPALGVPSLPACPRQPAWSPLRGAARGSRRPARLLPGLSAGTSRSPPRPVRFLRAALRSAPEREELLRTAVWWVPTCVRAQFFHAALAFFFPPFPFLLFFPPTLHQALLESAREGRTGRGGGCRRLVDEKLLILHLNCHMENG